MANNDLTKLTRWIIPGWLAIMAFYGFVIVDIIFYVDGSSNPEMYGSITEFLETLTPMNGILEVFFLAAAGVPLGFSIYQMYFLLRWNSPFSRDGLFPPIITGRMAELMAVLPGEIADAERTLGKKWREKWMSNPLFNRDHVFRAHYQELFFLEAIHKTDSPNNPSSFFARHLYLHEIAHTLGATTLAVYLGFVSYVGLKVLRGGLPLVCYLLITAVVVVIFFFLANKEYKQKQEAGKEQKTEEDNRELIPTVTFTTPYRIPVFGDDNVIQREQQRVHIVSPAAQFIFLLLLIQLWANPLFSRADPSPEISIILRGLVSLFVILIWLNSKKEHSLAFKLGDFFTLGSALIMALLFRHPFIVNIVDWSFFTAVTFFLIANMILLFNRQNTKEQDAALVYYVLKLFLDREYEQRGGRIRRRVMTEHTVLKPK